jgi:hypothetical protein
MSAPTRSESVRLPARGSGYTSANHRAIPSVGREVDPEWHDAFSADAEAKRNAQRAAMSDRVVNKLAAIGTDVESLRSILATNIGTPPARNRARRIANDLKLLSQEVSSERGVQL